MPYHLYKNATLERDSTISSTVGAFVKDDWSSREHQVFFGVTAAHAVLSITEQQDLSECHANPEVIRHRTTSTSSPQEILSIAAHNCQHIAVRDRTLPAYCHMIPTPEHGLSGLLPFQKFASDIVLLPIDAERVDRRVITETLAESHLSSYTDHGSVSDVDRPLKQTPIAGYIDIQNTDDIKKLCDGRVKVIVEGRIGKLMWQPETFTEGTYINLVNPSESNTRDYRSVRTHMIAPQFTFTTEQA